VVGIAAMTAASRPTPDGHSVSPPYVLVVDDEPDMLVNVARILRRGRYDCVTAASGEEAMTLFQHRRPDLILTDLRMPGMDGLALLRAVTRHVPPIPVVIFTAYTSEATSQEALAAGASAFLPKPFTGAQLLEAVRAALDHGGPVAPA
jgi:CheY-like chemotaxis protein